MRNKINTIRNKLILAFFASAAAAGVCMFLICIALVKASSSKTFAVFFLKHVGVFSLLLFMVLILMMIGFFLLLTRSKIMYLEGIIKTLDKIANGDLEIDIPVKSSDELGELAATVNSMAYKLKMLIEREKQWEKTKNELITNVSHDLRTPLTSILGYMELIANIKYADEESMKRYAGVALAKCKELNALIDNLFEYSKLTNAEIKINKVKINLGGLLEQVMLGFIPALEEAEMEYRMLFINEKISIHADPLLLVRVFENLINNAINYGKEGKRLDVELNKENNTAVVRIINYGGPVSDNDLPFIFERFYKADKSRFGKGSGAGLGLSIVKSIIEMHEGTVTASSLDNRTVFEVRIKINEELP